MKPRLPLLPALAITFAAGAGYSRFLVNVHRTLADNAMAGATCGGGGWLDCSKTLGGRYGELFGLPVAAYAEAWFVFLLALLLGGLWRKEPRRVVCRHLFWTIVPGTAATVAYAALSVLVLHVLCLRCCVLYAIVGLATALAVAGMEISGETRRRLARILGLALRVWTPPAVLFALVVFAEMNPPAQTTRSPAPAGRTSPAENQDGLPVIASDRAVLHVTEFVDFECAACRYSARQLDRFMTANPGAVELRCAILLSSCRHPTGAAPDGPVCLAARVGAVMQTRKLFWPYYKAVMLTDRVVDETLVWETVGLLVGPERVGAVRAELDHPATREILNANVALAERHAISQTPGWLINGRMETGAKTETGWAQLLAETRRTR